MMFWLMVVGVICLALGFVMGARLRQYRPIKREEAFMNYIGKDIKF